MIVNIKWRRSVLCCSVSRDRTISKGSDKGRVSHLIIGHKLLLDIWNQELMPGTDKADTHEEGSLRP